MGCSSSVYWSAAQSPRGDLPSECPPLEDNSEEGRPVVPAVSALCSPSQRAFIPLEDGQGWRDYQPDERQQAASLMREIFFRSRCDQQREQSTNEELSSSLAEIKPEYLLPAFAPVDTTYDANQPPLLHSILENKKKMKKKMAREPTRNQRPQRRRTV